MVLIVNDCIVNCPSLAGEIPLVSPNNVNKIMLGALFWFAVSVFSLTIVSNLFVPICK